MPERNPLDLPHVLCADSLSLLRKKSGKDGQGQLMEEKTGPERDSRGSEEVKPFPLKALKVFRVALAALTLVAACVASLAVTKSHGAWGIFLIAAILVVLGLMRKETPPGDDGSGPGQGKAGEG